MTRDDVTRIHERMDELFGAVSTIQQDVAALKATCPGCTGSIGNLKTILYGPPSNGSNPGLIGRVASLENSRHTARWAFRLMWTALFMLAGAVLGGAAQGWFSRG